MSTELRDAGLAFQAARRDQRLAASRLYEAIRQAVDEGMPETQAAKVAGVDRMTVRRALGKL